MPTWKPDKSIPVYIKFYKPFGVLCQFTDPSGRPTLKDFIEIPEVYPAGRLDFNSEGLIILTNDGKLLRRITHPNFAHPKTYLAQVEGIITVEAIHALNTAIVLPGLQTHVAQALAIDPPAIPDRKKPVRQYHPSSWVKLVIREGKKHQVRKMTAAVGFPTLRLIRISIGKITCSNLEEGQWRYLTTSELKSITSNSKQRRSAYN